MLINLKTPEILDRGRIGRPAEKHSEAPNMANVILLRMLPKATHLHVLQHALAERSVWGGGSDSIHAFQILRYVTPSDPPAERVRALGDSGHIGNGSFGPVFGLASFSEMRPQEVRRQSATSPWKQLKPPPPTPLHPP
ncbi:hypothetical protein KXV54_009386, partial [Aspergillus fumigatus]